jgi:hypothetical protein
MWEELGAALRQVVVSEDELIEMVEVGIVLEEIKDANSGVMLEEITSTNSSADEGTMVLRHG